MGLEKLGNKQTKDRIADMLRSEILSGRIVDGEELAQEQLAEILQVSRMPVREALQILELEGLLLRLPNRHMQVVGVNERTAQENMRIVAAVEAEIAAILIEQGQISVNGVNYRDDRSLHSWFSSQLNNSYLRQMHERLLGGYPQYVWSICRPDQFAEQNQRIWQAVQQKNATKLYAEIRTYYQDLAKVLLSHRKVDSE